MPKKSLRRQLLAQRRELAPDVWQAASAEAQKRLIGLELFRTAVCIALYAPIQCEIDTGLLFQEARSTGKRVLYPVVCSDSLQFREVTEQDQLAAGSFGILEPCQSDMFSQLATADLVVVPGVAFDMQGYRIGFGKGYYDRCISQNPVHGRLIGLCHDFQLLEVIPSEGHDIRMHSIVTDKRIVIPTGDEGRNRLMPD